MKHTFCFVLIDSSQSTTAQYYGINTRTPLRAKLEVFGGLGRTVRIFGGEGSGIFVQKIIPAGGFNHYYNGSNRFIANGFAAVLYLDQTNGSFIFEGFGIGSANSLCPAPRRSLTLLSNGGVQIGARSANASLSVDRNPGVEATAFIYGNKHHRAFNYGYWEDTYIRAGKDISAVSINDIPNGKIVIQGPVGINTEIPIYPLELRQYQDQRLRFHEAGSDVGWRSRVENTDELCVSTNGPGSGGFCD